MSRLCSNNRVAVMVDQAITKMQRAAPHGLVRVTKIEAAARKQKGTKE